MPISVATNANLPVVPLAVLPPPPLPPPPPTAPLFSIGIFQPQNLLTFAGPPIPQTTGQPVVTFVGNYTVAWYAIRDPENVQHTPPQVVGTDLYGRPSVRGFSQMVWAYSQMRPDQWYMFEYIWRLSRHAVGPKVGHVFIRWPDPLTGTIQTASGRWQKPSHSNRDLAQFHEIQLVFTHLGIDDAVTPQGIWKVTS